ncbi:hypothetical protein BDQ17DRAFT_1420431 [Cyathus striatus]|nr:hypothetical protein BDQ17DRAFT_1420431 [Cyathus striatus]
MGQSWRLYNLDKKLYIDFSNGLFKLGEWFFGNDPTRILTTLRSGSSTDSWAGDRVICLGSYLYANDLPNDIFTNEELTELNAKGDSLAFEDAVEDETYEISPVHLQRILDSMDTEVKVPEEENFDYSNYILRNLSKKEYIRGDNPPWPITDWYRNSFGQTLFSRICWSNDPFANILHPKGVPNITRGMWAGDRFDVILRETVKDELENDGWNDVTSEVKGQVEKIYKENGYYSPGKEVSRMEWYSAVGIHKYRAQMETYFSM